METLPIVGVALYVLGWLWAVVLAFRESLLWGVGSLFIPIVAFFFVISRWRKTWIALLFMVVGAAVFFASGGTIPS